jgi:phosphohistidine swiveling domain-containing protein
MVTVLTKAFVREFPLLLCQVWGARYANTFLDQPINVSPAYVFLLNEGKVTAYRNEKKLSFALNTIVKSKLDSNPRFIENIAKEKLPILEKMTKIITKKKLTQSELVYVANGIIEYWEVHYISQFVPLDTQIFSKEQKDEALELRKKIDKRVHAVFAALPQLIEMVYPVSKGLSTYVSYEDILTNTVSVTELKKRKSLGVILVNNKIVTSNTLLDYLKENKCVLESASIKSKITKVTGVGTFPGVRKGKVRIVFSEQDMPRVNTGEILIAPMFTPHMFSFLQNAIALVTDEGGVTCHAAIVSRERKIPCVIGTKLATSVFKTGDYVRCDATKGIVTITSVAKKKKKLKK